MPSHMVCRLSLRLARGRRPCCHWCWLAGRMDCVRGAIQHGPARWRGGRGYKGLGHSARPDPPEVRWWACRSQLA